ncbi:hypothetical protein [Phyllobacterium sp. P5_D12]
MGFALLRNWMAIVGKKGVIACGVGIAGVAVQEFIVRSEVAARIIGKQQRQQAEQLSWRAEVDPKGRWLLLCNSRLKS